MYKKIIEWQAVVILVIIIILGVRFTWERFTRPTSSGGATASSVEYGEIKELEQLVVSEQTNSFAEWAEFKPDSKLFDWLPGLKNAGKATVMFKWQARSLYGIKISDKTPLQWKRVAGKPGVIEIISPDIAVLETKVGLGQDEFKVVKIDKGGFVDEDQKAIEYLPKIEERSKLVAEKILSSERLRTNAMRIIAFHVISLINQGAAGLDKVHTANVVFRKS